MKTDRQPRMYSLFQKQNGKWVLVGDSIGFRKQGAIRIYQNALLASCFGGWPVLELRPVKGTETKGELITGKIS